MDFRKCPRCFVAAGAALLLIVGVLGSQASDLGAWLQRIIQVISAEHHYSEE